MLDRITTTAPREAFGIGPTHVMVAGDNPERIRSEAAIGHAGAAQLSDPRLDRDHEPTPVFRGGHRQANAVPDLINGLATLDYVTRRTAQGLSKKDIIRCLDLSPGSNAPSPITCGAA